MKIRISYDLALIFSRGTWYGKTVGHQPKFSWWQPFIVHPVRTNPDLPYTGFKGWNVWLYTRKDAICLFFGIDRRFQSDPNRWFS